MELKGSPNLIPISYGEHIGVDLGAEDGQRLQEEADLPGEDAILVDFGRASQFRVTEAGFKGSGVIGPRRAIPARKGRIPSGFGPSHVIPTRLKRILAGFGSAYVIPTRLGRIPVK